MSNTPLELKGSNFTLSVIHLHTSEPEAIRQALADKIALAPGFLRQAPVVVNVAALTDNMIDWPTLEKIVSDAELHIVGVSGCKEPTLKAQIEAAGLALLSEGKIRLPENTKIVTPPPEAPQVTTRVIEAPVRSGQRIYVPGGDLVVVGNVSAGAELIADGNIHIYGAMRGRALAGANGAKEAQIFCTAMMAELVSIAGEYKLSDQLPAELLGQAVGIRLTDGALTLKPLH